MDKSPDAFRTISEVADMLDTPAHVLRFWESRFAQVRPVKRAGGRRYYRPTDVALLAGIRALLHDQGVTIRGVQKILRERGVRQVAQIGTAVLAGLPVPHIAVPEEDRVEAEAGGDALDGGAIAAGDSADEDADEGAGAAGPAGEGHHAADREPAAHEPAPRTPAAPRPAARTATGAAEAAENAAAPPAARRPPPDGGAVIHDLFARLARDPASPPAAPRHSESPPVSVTPPDGLRAAAPAADGAAPTPAPPPATPEVTVGSPDGTPGDGPDDAAVHRAADGPAGDGQGRAGAARDGVSAPPPLAAPPPKEPAPLAVRLRALPPGAIADMSALRALAARLAALRDRMAKGRP
jgi:DNA-binding transcriptional MerR regulator